MKNEYNAVFRKITPVRSDEELLCGVLGKAEQMENKKGKSFKKVIIALCAAAVALCGAVTAVGASYGWNFNKLFGEFFNRKEEIIQQNPENDMVKELYNYDFEKHGKLINKTYELDGYTLLVKGFTATNSSVCIAYDVIFNDDFAYDFGEEDKNYEVWNIYPEFNVVGIDPELSMGVSAKHSQPQINGNVFSYISTINVNGITLEEKTVAFNFKELKRRNKIFDENGCIVNFGEAQTVECNVTLEVDVDFIDANDTILKEVGKEAVFKSGTKAYIERVVVSPFTIYAEYTDKEDVDIFNYDFTIILDDGTELTDIDSSGFGSSDGKTAQFGITLKAPVNTDRISFVKIGNLTIPLDENSEIITEEILIAPQDTSFEETTAVSVITE
ncbi:MAG: hypothetical protein ACI4J1_12955 [Ruminiclostridium sp.]